MFFALFLQKLINTTYEASMCKYSFTRCLMFLCVHVLLAKYLMNLMNYWTDLNLSI